MKKGSSWRTPRKGQSGRERCKIITRLLIRFSLICDTYCGKFVVDLKNRAGYIACVKRDFAPLAQLDRASDFGSEGWGFESLMG